MTDARMILLLRGTGGNERDLLDIATTIALGARLLVVRGRVVERGMPCFFRRAAELLAFFQAASTEFGFDATQRCQFVGSYVHQCLGIIVLRVHA